MARRIGNIIFLILITLYTIYYYFDTMRLRYWEEKIVVSLLSWILVAVVFVNIFQLIKEINQIKREKTERIDTGKVDSKIWYKQILLDKRIVLLLSIVLYTILIKILGFFVSSFLCFVILCRLLGTKRPVPLITVPVVTLGVIYAFFVLFLNIKLPGGLFF